MTKTVLMIFTVQKPVQSSGTLKKLKTIHIAAEIAPITTKVILLLHFRMVISGKNIKF